MDTKTGGIRFAATSVFTKHPASAPDNDCRLLCRRHPELGWQFWSPYRAVWRRSEFLRFDSLIDVEVSWESTWCEPEAD